MTQINTEVECVMDCRDKLGEGVFWCPAERALYWVDVPMPSLLHRFDPRSGRHDAWPMPEMITSLAKRADGTLLVASHHGLNIFDPARATLVRVGAPEADRPLNRANDGATDAKGRFWFGTMRNNIAPDGTYLDIPESTGVLYKVEAGLSIVPMDGGIGISNATCWSPDHRTMYFADTLVGAIHAYDFDLELGAISNKRVFARPEGFGYPDGATVDAEGYVWNARWEGGCLLRLAPDGSIDAIVKIPASRVTCCAFGGDDLETLYVTTSRLHLSETELAIQPQAGGVFALRPGVKGLPRPAFAG
ncbi:MAG: SMP-30/gluconolactonase/LRE family protein [Methylobacteriaceae bacterium]|nr:SMP-30/gluconolactonase/LRE family protein [Methylobacteriaceae bacterium]